ncbi:hypothetical protein vseg_007937 [Gypsophila vaccaria]
MAEISQMEKVMLAYSSPDLDFSDVFGGPPRRSSAQESGYSVRNSHSFEDNNDDDAVDVGSPWLTSREKPVFGEVARARRRYGSDDFFDDIFRGDQPSSSSQSPRAVPRRNPFSSAPGSRVMSPSRSLSSAETFANPAKFSLPGRLSTTDFVASTSMNQSLFNPSLSRFNQTVENNDADDNHSPTRFSAMQRQDTADGGSHVDGNTDQLDNRRNATGSEFPIYATNFHFSIYKWANKGVPLVVSLRKKTPRLKEATKVDNLSSNKSVRPSSLAKEHEQFNESLVSSVTLEAKTKDDNSPVQSNYIPVISLPNEIHKARVDVSSRGLQDATVEHSSGSVADKHNNSPKLLSKTKSNMRFLSALLSNCDEGNNEEMNEKTRVKTSMIKEKKKPYPIDKVTSHKVDKTKVHKSSATSKNDARTSEASGKVKDFVKIFNQDSSPKASGPSLRQSHSRRWKEHKTVEVDYEIRFSSARMNDETEASFVNWGEECPETSEMEYEHASRSQQFDTDDIGRVPDSSRQTSANESSIDSRMDPATKVNETVNDEALGEETKVLQWAKGKEGNIRALLSTLQYVLWPESGWKPVPLVDIIEANAVKRAYQKALLRLHPDKLQQKGAASHHKLIAEKVFDILQEAWGQFNSVDSL